MSDFAFDGEVLTKYIGSEKEVIIPEGCKAIGIGAFTGSAVTHVTLPDSLQEIGIQAFYRCTSLESIILSKSLCRVGRMAFANCSALKEIILPDTLDEIGANAFYYCGSLEKMRLPENLEKIEDSVFCGCKMLKDVVFPKNMYTIGKHAFEDCCSFEHINLPNELHKIDDCAFKHCISLKDIFIPESVKYIGMQAFFDCASIQKVENYSSASLLYGYVMRVETDKFSEPKYSNTVLPPILSGYMPGEKFDELKPDAKLIAVTCYLTSGDRYPEDKKDVYDAYLKKQCGKILASYIEQDNSEMVGRVLDLGYIKLPALSKLIDTLEGKESIRKLLIDYREANF